MRDPPPEPDVRLRALAVAVVVLGLIALVSVWRDAPPRPRPADIPSDEFSAERAWPYLETLVGDGIPHPVGSEHNAVVRQRVIDALEQSGYDPRVQTATVEYGPLRFVVNNVAARLEGTRGGGAVALVAHYDSVDRGPGAGDDAASVAIILEIARMLRAGPPPATTIIFLLTDGEERGMLGARAFMEGHPWADELAVVINLEGRGTSGPSLMFQTSRPNAWLIREFARSVDRPFAGSLFADIYERMPNDSDLTVFMRHGVAGYNFAFIGSPRHYHTADDTVENVNRASVQHQGDNAWSLVRSLAVADVTPRPGDAVYFDVFSAFMVTWPQGLSPYLAAGCLLLTGAAVAVLLRRGRLAWRPLLLALACCPLIGVGALLGCLALDTTFRITGAIPPRPWPEHPLFIGAALWSVTLVWIALVAGVAARRTGPWAWWAGVWLWWSVAAVVCALVLPSGSYLVIVPAGVAGCAGLVAALVGGERAAPAAAVIAAAAMACLWFPMELLFYDGLGYGANLVLAARTAIVLSPLAPLLAGVGSRGTKLVIASAGAVLVLSAVTALLA